MGIHTLGCQNDPKYHCIYIFIYTCRAAEHFKRISFDRFRRGISGRFQLPAGSSRCSPRGFRASLAAHQPSAFIDGNFKPMTRWLDWNFTCHTRHAIHVLNGTPSRGVQCRHPVMSIFTSETDLQPPCGHFFQWWQRIVLTLEVNTWLRARRCSNSFARRYFRRCHKQVFGGWGSKGTSWSWERT